jgi:ATP-dependent protease HslVU (ClpYQ) peptidase subunit
MTVIAFDGEFVAADRLASFGSTRMTTTKIHRVGNAIAGYAGDACFGEQVLDWYRNGADPAKFPPSNRDKDDWAGLVVFERGQPIKRYERTPFPVIWHDKQAAIGSGRDYALAAMHLGYDARRGVEVAIALDTGCGQGIDVLELNPAT